jgi:hypothetical protein
MKILIAAGAVPLLASGAAPAQDTHMMGSGMWGSGWMGGYGGLALAFLAVVAVVAIVVWATKRKGE